MSPTNNRNFGSRASDKSVGQHGEHNRRMDVSIWTNGIPTAEGQRRTRSHESYFSARRPCSVIDSVDEIVNEELRQDSLEFIWRPDASERGVYDYYDDEADLPNKLAYWDRLHQNRLDQNKLHWDRLYGRMDVSEVPRQSSKSRFQPSIGFRPYENDDNDATVDVDGLQEQQYSTDRSDPRGSPASNDELWTISDLRNEVARIQRALAVELQASIQKRKEFEYENQRMLQEDQLVKRRNRASFVKRQVAEMPQRQAGIQEHRQRQQQLDVEQRARQENNRLPDAPRMQQLINRPYCSQSQSLSSSSPPSLYDTLDEAAGFAGNVVSSVLIKRQPQRRQCHWMEEEQLQRDAQPEEPPQQRVTRPCTRWTEQRDAPRPCPQQEVQSRNGQGERRLTKVPYRQPPQPLSSSSSYVSWDEAEDLEDYVAYSASVQQKLQRRKNLQQAEKSARQQRDLRPRKAEEQPQCKMPQCSPRVEQPDVRQCSQRTEQRDARQNPQRVEEQPQRDVGQCQRHVELRRQTGLRGGQQWPQKTDEQPRRDIQNCPRRMEQQDAPQPCLQQYTAVEQVRPENESCERKLIRIPYRPSSQSSSSYAGLDESEDLEGHGACSAFVQQLPQTRQNLQQTEESAQQQRDARQCPRKTEVQQQREMQQCSLRTEKPDVRQCLQRMEQRDTRQNPQRVEEQPQRDDARQCPRTTEKQPQQDAQQNSVRADKQSQDQSCKRELIRLPYRPPSEPSSISLSSSCSSWNEEGGLAGYVARCLQKRRYRLTAAPEMPQTVFPAPDLSCSDVNDASFDNGDNYD